MPNIGLEPTRKTARLIPDVGHFQNFQVSLIKLLNYMEDILLKKILSRLSIRSFESFIVELFNDKQRHQEPFTQLSEAGEGVFFQPILDSYGGSLHTVFLLQYLPMDLFDQPQRIEMTEDPTLSSRLKKIKDIYKDKIGYLGMVSEELQEAQQLQSIGFLINLSDITRQEYEEKYFQKYSRLVQSLGIEIPLILLGSYDSFIEQNRLGVEDALLRFLTTHKEGITISLSEDKMKVATFNSEKIISGGILCSSKYPLEPVFVTPLKQKEMVLAEFEELIREDTDEAELEDFLVANYKDIFGPEYNRVETQLWLKFPDLDSAGKKRRFDIFLRNSVINDWELFEIKRVIRLTGTYRDVPVIAREVSYAIQQTKNYLRILSQDSVKRKFAKEGIEYFEPALNLVVGRTPQISHEQWRWLVTSHDKDIKIITFDDLLRESQVRLRDRMRFLGLNVQ